jgi:hypothetical protein
MRVYFAYKLQKPIRVRVNAGSPPSFQAYYRVGISFSKNDDKWYEGLPIGIPANVHLVYSKRVISKVRNAQRNIESNRAQNQEVRNEGSVIGLPVLYSDDDGRNECVGVIGISSPNPSEVTIPEYEALAIELSTLFSALFYAYGRFLQRSKSFDEVAQQLRSEIANHYESKYPLVH